MGPPVINNSAMESKAVWVSLRGHKHIKSPCLLLLMISERSARSTIGTCRVKLTCTTSWTSSMPLASTSSRRSASNLARLTILARSSASLTRSSALSKALKEPEIVGNYHDFVELCKLYDKNENGTMMLAELENILS